jgi:hypothetical protein
LIYARVHNRTVAEDYYAAMGPVGKRLNTLATPLQADHVGIPMYDSEQGTTLEIGR